jgi:hypothetical protein
MTTTQQPIHYISNKEFTQQIVEYIKLCDAEEAEGREAPVIPKSIALQFKSLATKLSTRYNFVNYTFRDEMVSNALFACCAKIRKFNINIGSNAFAYFTNVCWRAMVDVINYEEKMSYIKAKSFQSIEYDDALADNDLSEFSEYSGNVNDYIPFFDVDGYEKKMQDQKEKAKLSIKAKVSDNPLEVD